MWFQHLAQRHGNAEGLYPFPFACGELDFRPLLRGVIDDRLQGEDPGVVARRFHRGIAHGLRDCVAAVATAHELRIAVLSGGVFQNELLLQDLRTLLRDTGLEIWTNSAVPANDGGISLGQAALGAFSRTPPEAASG